MTRVLVLAAAAVLAVTASAAWAEAAPLSAGWEAGAQGRRTVDVDPCFRRNDDCFNDFVGYKKFPSPLRKQGSTTDVRHPVILVSEVVPRQVPAPAHAGAQAPAPFRDCPDCPEMIPLPGGSFSAGDARVRNAAPPADPLRHVGPFAMARTETTFRQWEACVAAGACPGGQDDHGWGRGDRPVINVTAADAQVYADWLSRRTGHAYRLPTEAEWEYAARAGSATLYPWGEEMKDGRANCRGCDGPVVEHAGTTPVATYPPNAFGLHDMNGNLWELTADCWVPDHMPAEPVQDASCKAHVMRGGAWYYVPKLAASAARARNPAEVWSYVVGFRVVRDLDDGGGAAR